MIKLKAIKDIVEDIREEIDGAMHYAKKAVAMKDTDKDASTAYADMARQELSHADRLHGLAVKAINAERAKGVEPPAAMQAVWDWEHEKMIDATARIRHLLDMVK